jgi:protein PhnA
MTPRTEAGWTWRRQALIAEGLKGAVMSDDEYVYDEASGEWLAASELAKRQAEAGASVDGGVEVRDSVGNLLADGDQVTLIKDLTVKGAGQTLKRGTLIKSIRLTGDPQEIDCRFDGIKGLVLRAEFVRKR